MSGYVAKTTVRLLIPELKGASVEKALEYFRGVLGEPEDLDQWDGKVHYFEYSGRYQPRREFSYGDTKDENWVVDIVVHENQFMEDEDDAYLSLETILVLSNDLCQTFSVQPENIMMASYVWYDGADEPIIVTPNKVKV